MVMTVDKMVYIPTNRTDVNVSLVSSSPRHFLVTKQITNTFEWSLLFEK